MSFGKVVELKTNLIKQGTFRCFVMELVFPQNWIVGAFKDNCPHQESKGFVTT
jgi:hypothetical protein